MFLPQHANAIKIKKQKSERISPFFFGGVDIIRFQQA